MNLGKKWFSAIFILSLLSSCGSKNRNPNVYFFAGERINGYWKATIRYMEGTTRYCIDLDYMNGECAYTLWM